MKDLEPPDLLPLHPKELTDEEFSVYKAEFDKVFSDPLCRNIALSGPYGAGKSSVIKKGKSLQEKRGERWIAVSLATFVTSHEYDADLSSSTQNIVEAEILRQLVHKMGTSKAPKSRLHNLKDRNRLLDTVIAISILVFALLSSYFVPKLDSLFSLQLSIAESIAFVLWLTIAGLGIYHLIRTNAISRIVRRIKVLEAELEITPSESASPYERCVDEIVYLLNASKINAVVFEDLDRFESIDIFEKMRNLNALANDSRLNGAKGMDTKTPLRFFFLVRDGIFKDPRDRTKFFDYIIPVIPYTDPNNAADIMRNAFSRVGLAAKKEFLYQLSSYIDDPRIIHDIADEAFHYKRVLFIERSFTDGDAERLIALLAYKAHFPRDFELLQVGRGYLHEILNGKHRLIERLETGCENERERLQEELEGIDRQLEVDEEELICMYAAPEMGRVTPWIEGVDAKQSNPHSLIQKAKSSRRASEALESIVEKLQQNDSYMKRHREIQGAADRRSDVIRARLERLSNKSETLRRLTIRQLVDLSPDADALFSIMHNDLARPEDFEELRMGDVFKSAYFPMVRFLVSSGYIDESYRRYISNFYSDLLCAEDDDYLSAIKQAKPIDLTYRPKAPSEIVRRMDQNAFARQGIRNPWLIAALFDSEFNKKIRVFMLSLGQPEGIRYLTKFIASEQFTPSVFSAMREYLAGDYEVELLSDEEISASNKRCYCKRVLTNGEDCYQPLISYINADPRFLEEDPRFHDEEIKKGLLRIDYRTEAIDFSHAKKTLVSFVYENCMFMPTPSIIDGYLNIKYGVPESMKRGTIITAALSTPGCPIKETVSEHLDYFVSKVVKEAEVQLEDKQRFVIAILNDTKIQTSTAISYISSLGDVEIEYAAQIQSTDYRKELLANQHIRCTADNVILFYQQSENSISDELAKLIETKGAPTGLNVAKCEEMGIDTADILHKLIVSESISSSIKREILNKCEFAFSSFPIEELDDETTQAMIDTKSIVMNGEMVNEFRLYKPNLALEYILSDLDTFLAMAEPASTDEFGIVIREDEVEGILKSRVDVAKKLTALSCLKGTIHLKEEYEDTINTAIAAEHLYQNDIVNLPAYYEKANGENKIKLACIFSQHVKSIMSEQVEFGWDLLKDSLRHLAAERSQALRLLSWYCREFGNERDRAELQQCFESAGLQEYAKLLGGTQSMISKSSEDDVMLSCLFDLGMCGKISPQINTKHMRRVYPKGHKQTYRRKSLL